MLSYGGRSTGRSTSGRKGWYAIRVRSSSELLAARQMEGLGYEYLAPTYPARRRWSDRMKAVKAPLFPGYVFCRMDPVERLPILKCSCVIEVVSAGRVPIEIDHQEIDAVRTVVDSHREVEPCPYLRIGQIVELDRGPLKGVTGILVEDRSGLVVSVTMLQRSVRVSVDEAWIDPRCYTPSSSAIPQSRVA